MRRRVIRQQQLAEQRHAAGRAYARGRVRTAGRRASSLAAATAATTAAVTLRPRPASPRCVLWRAPRCRAPRRCRVRKLCEGRPPRRWARTERPVVRQRRQRLRRLAVGRQPRRAKPGAHMRVARSAAARAGREAEHRRGYGGAPRRRKAHWHRWCRRRRRCCRWRSLAPRCEQHPRRSRRPRVAAADGDAAAAAAAAAAPAALVAVLVQHVQHALRRGAGQHGHCAPAKA
eukprot:141154-Chlamydomonas_euryale.AAC.2